MPLPRLARLYLIILLLIGVGLRGVMLTDAPPGLTHDEANHGREGISILDGDLRLFYPLNYGSEPLYSYLVAASMGLWGENIFALRMVGVLFGVILISLVFRFVSKRFDIETALYAAGFLAVGYWPLVASRMALRATLMPVWVMLAVFGFWLMLASTGEENSDENNKGTIWPMALFVSGITGMWYTYLAARIVWVLFPIFALIYIGLKRLSAGNDNENRIPLRQSVINPLIGLVIAGILIAPMFIYLAFFPDASTRLDMLDGPLQRAAQGDLLPILTNTWQALIALVWPGKGDQFLAYNIPGKPVLDVVSAILFLVGLGVALWRWRQPTYLFLVIWLGFGLLPSLLTGPTANTTRNVGALPVLFILVGVGASALRRALLPKWRANLYGPLALGLILIPFFLTARNYFFVWANDPDVRAAYQTTLIAALDVIEADPERSEVMLSTIYPGPAHDPSIALVMLDNKDKPLRWMDGRFGLLFPGDVRSSDSSISLYVPSSTPLHPAFSPLFNEVDAWEVRPSDLDPTFIRYQLNQTDLAEKLGTSSFQVDFGDGLRLVRAEWSAPGSIAGGVAEMVTYWEVLDPAAVGPIVWPIETTDVVFFTQVLTPDRTIVAQSDRLDAPSWGWESGDVVVQVHQLFVPGDAISGEYQTIVGVYDRQSGVRLPNLSNPETPDYAVVPNLIVE